MLEFLKNTLYIQLATDYLSVLQVESNELFLDQPWLAINQNKSKYQIVSYGQQALTMTNTPDIKIVNGFNHPRTIIADFDIAQLAITYSIKQVSIHRKFLLNPVIIIHPVDELEGGLTPIEVRALKELCYASGARMVYCWQGANLSIDELKSLSFPLYKGRLLD